MKNYKIVGGYKKDNEIDLSLTPNLFLVRVNQSNIKLYGLGVNWLNRSIYIAISKGYPKEYPRFKNLTQTK